MSLLYQYGSGNICAVQEVAESVLSHAKYLGLLFLYSEQDANGKPCRKVSLAVPVLSHALERQGLAYLTFIVADLDGVIKRLRDHGVRLLSGGEKVEVRPGLYAIYSIDPEGNFIEFVEYPDVASYRPDLCK